MHGASARLFLFTRAQLSHVKKKPVHTPPTHVNPIQPALHTQPEHQHRVKERIVSRSSTMIRASHHPLQASDEEDLEALRLHLEALPKELHNMIFTLTFTPSHDVTIPITFPSAPIYDDEFCQGIIYPPKPRFIPSFSLHLAQISRSTRALYMPLFFSRTTFTLDALLFCDEWTENMPSHIQDQVKEILCRGVNVGPLPFGGRGDIKAWILILRRFEVGRRKLNLVML